MFQNSYQNGTYFDLYDPKVTQDKQKQVFRMVNVSANNKVFDKDLKTFVMEFLSPNAKMCFPKEERKDLYLIQQYLVLQIYFFPGMSWNVELVISDLTKTKRRIILSPATTKTQIKPFFVKTPVLGFKEGTWNNFVVDLYSYIQAFKGQTYRSLDAIYLTGHFKLRRIYSTTSQPMQNEGENQSQQIKQISFLPKNFYFPMGVPYATKINKYDGEIYSQATIEPTEPSSKNSSFLKPTNKAKTVAKPQNKQEVVKTQKVILKESRQSKQVQSKKIRDFLSNTNGELISRRKKQEDKSESQSSQVIQEGPPKTTKSTQKYAKKKNLIKTQQIPPKARSSLDRNPLVNNKKKQKQQDKTKTKAKLNPWRSNTKKQGFTDTSHLQISKNQQDRNIETPQTVELYKTKNNLASKFSETKNNKFDRKSDQCSDSQYVELSQKFSTLTDGKFFRNQIFSNHIEADDKNQDHDEIEENIEMQTNSMYSNSNKKQEQKRSPQRINESICDSLDRFQQKQKRQMFDALGRSSLYGFGEQLMKNFMCEIERPYSPPIGQRQVTEQQVTEGHHDQKQQVQLIYDPVLNCYYDHKTHTYYELKN